MWSSCQRLWNNMRTLDTQNGNTGVIGRYCDRGKPSGCLIKRDQGIKCGFQRRRPDSCDGGMELPLNWSQMPMVTAWSAHSDDDSTWMTASLISRVLSFNPKHIWGLILCHLCCKFVTWSSLLCKCNHGGVIRLITQAVMYQSDLSPAKYSQSQSLLGSLSDLIELKCYCLGNESAPHNLVFFSSE